MSGDDEEYAWPSWSATAAAFSVVALSLAAVYHKRQQSLAEQQQLKLQQQREEKERKEKEEEQKKKERESEEQRRVEREEQEKREREREKEREKERAEQENKEREQKENEEREKREREDQEVREREEQERLRKEREANEAAAVAKEREEQETEKTKVALVANEEESQTNAAEEPPSSEATQPEGEEQEATIIKDIYTIEEMNEPGLVRGRKTTSIRDGRRQKQVYQMEDVCLVEYPFDQDPNKALLAVFDGHAGKFAADAARGIVSKHVKQNIDDSTGMVDLAKVFRGIETELAAEGRFDCEGCTATVAFIHRHAGKRFLQVANVGDSTAFLRRGSETTALSVDHKVSNPDERERIRGMGVALEDRHTRLPTIGLAVSRALCDFFAKEVNSGLSGEPYVHPVVEIAPRDRVIIASDGLWDIVSGAKAFDITQSLTSAKDIAKTLVEAAVSSAECQDNVTVVVVLL